MIFIVFSIKPAKKIRSELIPKTLNFSWPKGFWDLFLNVWVAQRILMFFAAPGHTDSPKDGTPKKIRSEFNPKTINIHSFSSFFSLFFFGFSWNSHFSQGRDAKKNLSRIQHKNTEYSQVFIVFWWFSIVFPIEPPKKIRSELAPKTMDFRWPKGFWYLFSECLGGPKDFDVFRGSWTFSSFSFCFLSIENHWFLLEIDGF